MLCVHDNTFVQNISLETLLKIMHQHQSRFDEDKVKEAYFLAKKLHEGQNRFTGEPYITHPLAVAIMLAEWGADQDTIIVALLHDTVEDTSHTVTEVEKIFGKDIRNLVYGITKISKGALRDKQDLDRSIESLRRWFDIMQTDVRVAIIKLFDRWHNMQTLGGHAKRSKQKIIAQETIDIYARIAKKLSMYDLAFALEDLALPYVSTKYYQKLKSIQKKHTKEGMQIENHVRQQLVAYDYHNKISSLSYTEFSLGTMYSENIHKKHELKGFLPFTFTIITPTVEDCYYILFLIHNIWKVKEEGVKDFISTPSASRYQALHTSVLYRGGINIIFKIRTQEMQDYYQKGITQFCFSPRRGIEKNFPWIQNLSYVTKIDKGHSKKFFEKLKQDVLGNNILVYTVVDEPVLLPEKSSVLDAAFYIHGKDALHLSKAFVNGSEVKKGFQLTAKSIVHFVFASEKTITPDWLSMVKTALATSMVIKAIDTSKM